MNMLLNVLSVIVLFCTGTFMFAYLGLMISWMAGPMDAAAQSKLVLDWAFYGFVITACLCGIYFLWSKECKDE